MGGGTRIPRQIYFDVVLDGWNVYEGDIEYLLAFGGLTLFGQLARGKFISRISVSRGTCDAVRIFSFKELVLFVRKAYETDEGCSRLLFDIISRPFPTPQEVTDTGLSLSRFGSGQLTSSSVPLGGSTGSLSKSSSFIISPLWHVRRK